MSPNDEPKVLVRPHEFMTDGEVDFDKVDAFFAAIEGVTVEELRDRVIDRYSGTVRCAQWLELARHVGGPGR